MGGGEGGAGNRMSHCTSLQDATKVFLLFYNMVSSVFSDVQNSEFPQIGVIPSNPMYVNSLSFCMSKFMREKNM